MKNFPALHMRSGTLPADYSEELHWNISGKTFRFAAVQLSGLVLFALFGWAFFILSVEIGKLPMTGSFSITAADIGAAIVAVAATLALHELAHGLAMRIVGAKPKFRAIWKRLLLTTTTPGFLYHRDDYIFVLLAPVFVISAAVIGAMGMVQGTLWVLLLALCGAIDASGAIGDMYLVMVVLRYPSSARIIDEIDGLRVFLPSQQAESVALVQQQRPD